MKTDRKRIVVLENGNMLFAGGQSILADYQSLDVIGVDARNLEEVYQTILSIQPDVIILEKNSQLNGSNGIMDFLRQLATVRTIVVDPQGNQVLISEGRQVNIEQISDFLDIL